MIQQEIDEILADKSYQEMDKSVLINFFREMISISMYKKISLDFDAIEYFVITPPEYIYEIIKSQDTIIINRILSMAAGFTDEQIYKLFNSFNKLYKWGTDRIYVDVYNRYNLNNVSNGCIAFFLQHISTLMEGNLQDLVIKINDLLLEFDIDFNEINKIDSKSIKNAKKYFYESNTSEILPPHVIPFHYPLFILELKTEEKYIEYLFKNKKTKVNAWSSMWPNNMYQKFIDKISGDLEKYYKNKINLPLSNDISDDDFDYYKYFLNVSQITQDILSKEQIIKYSADLRPEDIILNNNLNILEMKELGTFSVVLYAVILVKKCLYDKEIFENVDIFTPKLILDSEIWVSSKTWQAINDYHGGWVDYTVQKPSIFSAASRKKDFSIDYLEYLMTNNQGFSIPNILNSMMYNTMPNLQMQKQAIILNRLENLS